MLVNVDGIMFEVEGSFYPPCRDSIDCPGHDGEIEIESISIGDQDITDFLTDEQYTKIKDKAIVDFAEDYSDGEDAMDVLRDRRLDR